MTPNPPTSQIGESVTPVFITSHLDTWTAAIKTKSSAGRGGGKKEELYGIKKLRELILELAVRGLLVPQDPEDEPASELLKKIKAEEARLLKAGVVKKRKPLSKGQKDEPPFTIPESWAWIRLAEVGHDWGQKTPDSDFTYIDVSAINKEHGIVSEPTILSASDAPSRARKIVRKGTVIYSTVRPYLLNIAVVTESFDPEPIASTAFAIVHPFQGIEASFIYRYLRSPSFIQYVESCQTGIAYPAINDKQFFAGLLPLPPFAEQHRIVAKVDELMALCDQLEQRQEDSARTHGILVKTLLGALTTASGPSAFTEAWQRIAAHFDTLFTTESSIDQLKQTILQLAVMGKLVEQDPEDEPADKLLIHISKQKEKLLKSGMIRKIKPCRKFRSNEIPYEVPLSWCWTMLGEITDIGTGSTPSRTEGKFWDNGTIPWVTSGSTSQERITNGDKLVTEAAVKEHRLRIYSPGTLLVALYGQGKTRGQVATLTIPATINQACAAICPLDRIKPMQDYIKLLLEKQYDEMRSLSAGGAQPNLNVQKIKELFVPLPPLAEQKRIVAKVDELMAICDRLKAKLKTAQETQVHLADSLVETAIHL
jgi:type I restriction enzyme S subunit